MDYLQEEQLKEASSGNQTSKVFWILFFGIVFIILFLIVYLAFITNHKNISNDKLMEGVALEVGENDAVKFDLDEQEHGMKINFVGYDSVEVTISSEPINLTLKIDEVKEVDLDGDGFYDLRIKLVKIIEGKATIAIQKIDRESCQESWDCSSWSDCSNGEQERDCDDRNSCGTTFYKPFEEKDCLEIEFIENDSFFKNNTVNLTNLSLNNFTNISLNNTSNFTFNNSNQSSNLTINTTKPLNTTILNCGATANYSCFINASKTCRLAKWTLSQQINAFGVLSYSTRYFEIKGNSSDGRCIYYEKYISGGLDYTDVLVHDLLQEGYTLEQVNKMEESAKYEMSSIVGTENICKFNRAHLTELLIKWQSGSFSTSDYDNAECYPHSTFDCKLDFIEDTQVSGISISSIDSVYPNVIISVKGFSDYSKVIWSVENSSIIRLYPLVGNYSKIYPLKVGRTIINVKDTSLSSCELKIPFEVYQEASYDLPICDNDTRCEWDENENLSNCPYDCLGNSNFLSNYSCESNEDCYYYEDYPICVLDVCAKPTQTLKYFIYQNYPTTNCEALTCYGCQLGKFHATGVGYYGFELEFCSECSKYGSIFPCREGYFCEKGRCIYNYSSPNNYPTGTYPYVNTSDSDGISY